MSARQGVCQESPPAIRAAANRTFSHSLISFERVARSRFAIRPRSLWRVGRKAPSPCALVVTLLPEASPQCDGGIAR